MTEPRNDGITEGQGESSIAPLFQSVCIQNLVGFCQFVLKILSGNEILTSIKGRNSVKILRKMTGNNPKLDLVNVDVHTKFGWILSIRSRDIERKRNSDVNQGP